MTQLSDVSRQRIDYQVLPDGRLRAHLTVTIGNQVKRFAADMQPGEVDAVNDEEAAANGGVVGFAYEVGFFGKIFKGVKKLAKGAVKAVGNVAKTIASSKVLKLASPILATIAPALGPLAPAALAASAAIGVASKIALAKSAVSLGKKVLAKGITTSAIADAKKIAPKGFGSLLKTAQQKATAITRLAPPRPVATQAITNAASQAAIKSLRRELVTANMRVMQLRSGLARMGARA